MRTAAPSATSIGSGVLLDGSATIVSSSAQSKRPRARITWESKGVKAYISALKRELVVAGFTIDERVQRTCFAGSGLRYRPRLERDFQPLGKHRLLRKCP